MALIQTPYLINEVNHLPSILGSMRTAPSINFIWVYLQYCSAISWWVNWNLSNKTLYSNSFFPSAMRMPIQTEGRRGVGEKQAALKIGPILLLEWHALFSCQHNSPLESSHGTDLTCLRSCLGEGGTCPAGMFRLPAVKKSVCCFYCLSSVCK